MAVDLAVVAGPAEAEDLVEEALAASAAAAVAVAAPVVAGKWYYMTEYIIDVSRIEELQTLNDRDELEKIFAKAQSTIVNGESVILVRKSKTGSFQKFDEFSTLDDLHRYREIVFKYL